MSATLIGKGLVVVNVVSSVVFAAGAVGIYTNRIDWAGTSKPAAGETPAGEVDKRAKEIQKWIPQADQANLRLQASIKDLAKVEADRPREIAWYQQQLDILEGKVAGPIMELVYRDGKLQPESGRPSLHASEKGLQSRTAFLQDLKTTHQDIERELAKIAELIEKERLLVLETNGDKGKVRGLRDLLEEEEKARKLSADELEYLRPIRILRQIEADSILRRQKALESYREHLLR